MEGNSGVTVDSREIVPVRDDKKVSLETCTKKNRGPMHLLRAAMFVLRRWKKSKPLYAEVTSTEVLNKLVGSMRQLNTQTNLSPPHEAALVTAMLLSTSPQDLFLDVPPSPVTVLIPLSPNHSSTTSEGGTSRYASVLNCQELNKMDDREETGHCQDNELGDEMIDLKADKFIAQFYEQMMIQNQNEMDHRSKMRHHHDRQQASDVREG